SGSGVLVGSGLLRVGPAGRREPGIAVYAHEFGFDRNARSNSLQAIYDDTLPGSESRLDDAQSSLQGTELHLAIGRAVLLVNHHNEALVLIGTDGGLLDQDRRPWRAAFEAKAGV